MASRHIRPISLGLIWKDTSLLVAHGVDPLDGQPFFRPLGGGLEFGERAIDALRREFVEEIGAELCDERFITVLENLFRYDGQPHHELVFVFEARFKDARLYERAEFEIHEQNMSTTASWMPLRELVGGDRPLYPAGLESFLSERASAVG
jgi:ADP-ribose pyrophosphatase YjhB (NUDIX family)